MDEDVEGCVELGQLDALPEAEEGGLRQAPPQRRAGRPVADDDEAHAGQSRHRRQQVQPLLRSQPTHVSDEQFPAGGQLAAKSGAAVGGGEQLGVDSPGPAADRADAVPDQRPDGR